MIQFSVSAVVLRDFLPWWHTSIQGDFLPLAKLECDSWKLNWKYQLV